MAEIFKCPICGGNTETHDSMRGHSAICTNCIRRIAVLYPFEYTEKGGHPEVVCHFDGVSAEQLESDFEKAHQYREDLLRRYDYKYAVFEVARVAQAKGGLLQPSYLNVFGRPLYGEFHIFDEVWIDHAGERIQARIDAIANDAYIPFKPFGAKEIKDAALFGTTCTTACEGGVYVLAFKNGRFDVAAGDILYL
ncbi:MAG: hypothetical protein IKI21_11200 [Oscillospiraceae bacterium]|nr:hypothetical protein [Oscillospiraceae bacterium]